MSSASPIELHSDSDGEEVDDLSTETPSERLLKALQYRSSSQHKFGDVPSKLSTLMGVEVAVKSAHSSAALAAETLKKTTDLLDPILRSKTKANPSTHAVATVFLSLVTS